ncbi:hypothetical protein [Paenibacillus sp. MBLB4367]|uniref:hypothetical protein n=1 Tax=Paenibacillus sp. MBLB4367 TaxID=3384767 RepID=UPI0039082414
MELIDFEAKVKGLTNRLSRNGIGRTEFVQAHTQVSETDEHGRKVIDLYKLEIVLGLPEGYLLGLIETKEKRPAAANSGGVNV